MVVVASSIFWLGGCGGSSRVRIDAGGATFPNPIIQKWKDVYSQEKQVEIDYQEVGSGQGIKSVISKKFVFGCSDAPMNKSEVAEADKEGGEVIHVPVTMGAVAIVYNLPGIDNLVLDGPLLASIFLGDVSAGGDPKDLASRKPLMWNDKRIKDMNPKSADKLPEKPVNPVGRSDSSGTSNIFTEYLSKSSGDFAKAIGTTKSPKWPPFCSLEDKSSGIAGRVAGNELTIGYVELSYAKKNNISFATMRNRKGKDIAPEAKAVTAAAAAALAGPKPTKEPYSLHELTYSLTDVDDENAYPICGFSYALLYKKQKADKGKPTVEFLKWATSKGQEYANDLHYAPLPQDLTKKVHERLGQVVFE
jgi:phosphate transport system substrate-binding protein